MKIFATGKRWKRCMMRVEDLAVNYRLSEGVEEFRARDLTNRPTKPSQLAMEGVFARLGSSSP